MVTSVIGPHGLQNDYIIPESLTCIVPAGFFNDTGASVTLGSEPITIQAQLPTSNDPLDTSSPSYSGVSTSMIITDPTISGTQTGQNLLVNSDFQNFVTTANVPDSWSILAGTAGTNVLEGSSPLTNASGIGLYNNTNLASDTACLELASGGSVLAAVVQPFGTGTGGNGSTVAYGSIYAVGFFAEATSVSGLSAGTLSVDLVDSSGGTGSGATVTFTVSGGAINAVTGTPAAGGTGYPASSTFNLTVTTGGGVGGIVQATTNGSGVVTSFATTQVAGGSGYSGTTGASTGPLVVSDDDGNANHIAVLYSALTTSYQFFNGFFRLPTNLSSYTLPLRTRVSQSTPFTSGKNTNVTAMAVTQAVQLYAGGPYVAVFRNAVDAVSGDSAKIVYSNNWASSAKAALYLNQIFGLRALGLLIPSLPDSPATFPESTITD
jgi:hypothetical protein